MITLHKTCTGTFTHAFVDVSALEANAMRPGNLTNMHPLKCEVAGA